MTTRSVLIDELGHALAVGTCAQHTEMLTRITDLFLAGAERFSAEQINLFDEVIARLASRVDAAGRADLSTRLAALPNAPTGVMRMLAFDDDIEVARPMLRECEGLDDADLIASANTKSQLHLAAIAERSPLSATVTDVLLKRGSHDVVRALAANADARFSDVGMRMLVRRACSDDALAMATGLRRDLPRLQFLQLLARAPAAVRARLVAANPAVASVVGGMLSETAAGIRGESCNVAVQYAPAAELKRSKHADLRRPRPLRHVQAPATGGGDDLQWWPADELAIV